MKIVSIGLCIWLLALTGAASHSMGADDPWVTYTGASGPGKGKRVVLISGDEEYRSEEALPMLAKILAVRHGFDCTVLFAMDSDNRTIDPKNQTNIPGLDQLKSADLMVIALRFRELPDDQMKHIVEFTDSGKPIIGLRTATHAFRYQRNPESPYAKYHFRSREWAGGFGRQVLGDTWVNHHGHHGKESTRGVIDPAHAHDPIMRGVDDIWGPTDVYGVSKLTPTATVLVHGQVLAGMKPTDKPVEGKKNSPMMPLAWTKTFVGASGKPARVFCTTMGASVDFESAGLRRLFVNACYWGLGMEDRIPAKSNVDYVGEFKPKFFGFDKHTPGVKPSDHRLSKGS